MDRHDAERAVDGYLQLCEDRDLDAAARCLASGVRLEFPGGVVYRSLEEMAAASAGRYRWVRKRRERYLVGDGSTVTSIGTLYGQRLDGTPFEGVRYVDVFVLDDAGRITEQLVWNDLAEVGITHPLQRRAQP
jgi:hypothetical protein